MELTDREIRGVGFDRYVRRRIRRIVVVVLAIAGLMFLIRWLMPTDLTLSRWVGVAALFVIPYGGAIWAFWRAHKAGRRFLAQWKSEEDLAGLDGADYRNEN